MSWIDWTIMAVAVVSLRLLSMSTRHYMKGVADFLSANRCAGRYLLTIAGQMGGTGAISVIGFFQMYYSAGLPPIWWDFMNLPVGLFVIMTGWVYYRYRQTRAMTLAQFLEMRYSYRFRVLAGFVMWSCGILNFGIFPAVTARFFVYYCGLPPVLHLWGMAIPTVAPIMALDLGMALTFVTMGGQVSIMVTECAQGMVSAFAFIVIAGVVLMKLSWGHMAHVLVANSSMVHPFHTSDVKTNYTIWYFLIGAFGTLYGMCSWQGSAGFMTSGKSAHEQKMGQIISVWRELPLRSMYIILPIAAYAILRLPEYSGLAAAANATLNGIQNPAIRSEMTTPVVLSQFLPVGIKGLFATVMLFFSFTCHDTYMHSWGSIFVQDIVLPIRKRPLDPARHVKWLRWSIVGVAVFAFFFSLLYDPKEDIMMFFAITGTIWAGGSGAVIIGGLYWRKGTTLAAYCSLVFGAIVGVGGLLLTHWYQVKYKHEFPMNQQWLFMLSMVGAAMVYIVASLMTHSQWIKRLITTCAITAAIMAGIVLSWRTGLASELLPNLYKSFVAQDVIVKRTLISMAVAVIYTLVCLLTCQKNTEHDFNLDWMLHRGAYSDKTSEEIANAAKVSLSQRLVGITSEFSTGDKVLAMLLIVWQLGWTICFFVVNAMNLITPGKFPVTWWAEFWHIYLLSLFFMGIPITIWFTIGGVFDIKALFKSLASNERNAADDGRVVCEPDVESETPISPAPHIETSTEEMV